MRVDVLPDNRSAAAKGRENASFAGGDEADTQSAGVGSMAQPHPSQGPGQQRAYEVVVLDDSDRRRGDNARAPGNDGATPQRKWRSHAGNNRFFCNGRLVMSRQGSVLPLTIVLIVATFALFCYADLPYLTARVSVALPFLVGALFLLTMASLLKASFSDPGIIPRASMREVIEWERNESEAFHRRNTFGVEWSQPRLKTVMIGGQAVKLKFCYTCSLFRPPRSSHCSVCGNCTLGFDHHCPFIGNCVGLRNYRYFYWFVSSLAVLDCLVGGCVIAHLVMLTSDTGNFYQAIKASPLSGVVGLVNVVSIWSIAGLSCFHAYLMAISQTTNEDIKGTFSSKIQPPVANPYKRKSLCANFCSALCVSEHPSLLDGHGVAKPDRAVPIDAELLARLALTHAHLFAAAAGGEAEVHVEGNGSQA